MCLLIISLHSSFFPISEEYSSVSSSQIGTSTYMESSSSAVKMEASSYQTGNSIETRTSTAKIEGGGGIGKPVFVKTLEGSSVERKWLNLKDR